MFKHFLKGFLMWDSLYELVFKHFFALLKTRVTTTRNIKTSYQKKIYLLKVTQLKLCTPLMYMFAFIMGYTTLHKYITKQA